jgi:hypothetical protein
MNDDNFLMRCGRRLEHSCLVLSAADVADRGENRAYDSAAGRGSSSPLPDGRESQAESRATLAAYIIQIVGKCVIDSLHRELTIIFRCAVRLSF